MRNRTTDIMAQGIWKRSTGVGASDLLYPVRIIRERLGPVHPLTGMPTVFRTFLGPNQPKKTEIQSLLEMTWDFSLFTKLSQSTWYYESERSGKDDSALFQMLEMQRPLEKTGKWSWETCDTRPRIIRTDDDTTPDVLMFCDLQTNFLWGNAGAWLQPLADGGCARYYVQTGSGQNNVPEGPNWISLWRIEYPDGRIIDVMDQPYDTEKSYSYKFWANYAKDDIGRSRGKNGVEIMVEGDRVLVDGSGGIYGIVTDRGFAPFVRFPGNAVPPPKSGGWEKMRYQTGPLVDRELGKLISIAMAPDEWFKTLRPSDAIKLFFGIGSWGSGVYNGYKLGQCNYDIPWYDAGLAKVSGHKGAILEQMIRQRLWLLRQDLQKVRLSDGSQVAAMIDPLLFPPLDGKFLQQLGCRWDKITKAVNLATEIVMAVVPGGWALELTKLGLEATRTILDVTEAQKQIGPILSLMESGQKFARLATDASTGIQRIVVEDPPSPAQKALEDRAAGNPTAQPSAPASSASSGSSAGILVAAVAAAALLASR